MKLLRSALLGAILVTGLVAVGAQAQQQQPAAPAVQAANPNEVLCERQTVVGSRLAHKKVCMTRSQWDEARRGDREAVEKVQRERGMNASPTQPGG